MTFVVELALPDILLAIPFRMVGARQMKRLIRVLLLATLPLALAGCARTTTITGPDSEALAVAHSVPVELVELNDRALQEQVSYLGRYLLGDAFRVSVAKNGAESDWGRQALVDLVEYRSIGNSTGLGMAVSQAATGDLLSSQGSDVAFWSSVGIDVINSVLATQRMSDVSGFFMPAKFGDIDVESAEHATKLAVDFTETRIREAAESSGYETTCHLQCEPESKSRIYKLVRTRERPGQFTPLELFLYWGYFDLIPMPEKSEDYLLSHLLEFVPEYTSKTGNTWTIYLGTKLTLNKKKNTYLIDRYSRLVTTPLSREIRQELYAGQRNMFWGSSVAEVRSAAFYIKERQPGLIYFDDQVYGFPDSIGKVLGRQESVSVTHTVR